MARTAGAEGAKTSTLSVRLTPKMRFGLEMMARLHRDSIPEIVTRAINNIFSSEYDGLWDSDTDSPYGRRWLMKLLWAERPSDRLANLAFHCPSLMSSAENRLWSHIKSESKFWKKAGAQTEKNLLREMLAQSWENLQSE